MIETDEREARGADTATRALPAGWRWVRLGDHVVKVGSGVTPRGGQSVYHQHGVPLIRSQNIRMNWFDPTGLAYISAPQDEEMKATRVLPDDVLLNITGASIGRVCVAPPQVCPANVNQHVSIIRPNGSIEPAFLSFFMSTSEFQRLITDSQAGATRQALTKALIEDFQIPLPPLAEQRRIAAMLRERMAAVERARAAAEAQLAAARALPAAWLRAVFESDEARGWPQVELGSIAKTCSGTTPSRGRTDYYQGTIPWVKTAELQDGLIQDTEEHVTEQAVRETSLKILPAGTLLVAMYGQGRTRGRTGLLACNATTNQACFAVLPRPEVFDSAFLQHWFRGNYARLRVESEGRGGNQPNLNGEILESQSIAMPSVIEQRRLSSKLSQQIGVSDQIEQVLQSQLDTINQLLGALLRQAFSGEL